MTGPTSATPLSARIHARLRAEILDGALAARRGAAVRARLSEQLGASRHAVREALKRLQQAGLVHISQGGATRVRDWRRHGGLDLLLDARRAGRRPAGARGRRARCSSCAPASAPTPPAAAPSAPARRAAPSSSARAASARRRRRPRRAQRGLRALWDLVIEGAGNLAYRLALNTLVAGQHVAGARRRARRAPSSRRDAIRALAAAIAAGDAAARRRAPPSCSNARSPRRADPMAEVLYYAIPFFVLLLVVEALSYRTCERRRPRRLRAARHAHEPRHGPRQRRRSTSSGSSRSWRSTPRCTS